MKKFEVPELDIQRLTTEEIIANTGTEYSSTGTGTGDDDD